MANFLDYNGLEILWGRIKQKFIQQPAANSVTANHVATFTTTTVDNVTTMLGDIDDCLSAVERLIAQVYEQLMRVRVCVDICSPLCI